MKEKKNALQKRSESEPVEVPQEEAVFVPTTDIYEQDDRILMRCDLPGVAQGDVDIRLDNTELEIVARQMATSLEGFDLLSGEYGTGVYRRRFTVPYLIDRDRIRARLQGGVLEIELPKAEQAKPRRIEIVTGA